MSSCSRSLGNTIHYSFIKNPSIHQNEASRNHRDSYIPYLSPLAHTPTPISLPRRALSSKEPSRNPRHGGSAAISPTRRQTECWGGVIKATPKKRPPTLWVRPHNRSRAHHRPRLTAATLEQAFANVKNASDADWKVVAEVCPAPERRTGIVQLAGIAYTCGQAANLEITALE